MIIDETIIPTIATGARYAEIGPRPTMMLSKSHAIAMPKKIPDSSTLKTRMMRPETEKSDHAFGFFGVVRHPF